jgi:hypothetical protein
MFKEDYAVSIKYDSNTLDLFITDRMMVSDLYIMIEGRTGLKAATDYFLVFKQKQMQMGACLGTYFLEEHCVIHLVLNLNSKLLIIIIIRIRIRIMHKQQQQINTTYMFQLLGSSWEGTRRWQTGTRDDNY